MNWRAKGLIQRALTYLPGGGRMHYLLQRKLGGLRNFQEEFGSKVDDWCIMAGHLQRSGQPIAGARMMEIGTGWYPTLPFCCYLAGAARVATIDLNRHVKPDLTKQCAEGLASHVLAIARACELSESEVSARHGRLLEKLRGTDLAAATGGVIEYRAPGDARRTGFPDGSFDVVFSNSVLEHVPADAIRDIFVEAGRLLPDGKIMFHSLNCGDHYAYSDPQISQLNYLQFSEAGWKMWNTRFLYQNRLRAHEFLEMAKTAGFAIMLDTAKPSERRLRELGEIPVHAQFASRFTPEQLCVTSVDFIGRKHSAADVEASHPIPTSLTDRSRGRILGLLRAPLRRTMKVARCASSRSFFPSSSVARSG